MLKRHIEKRLLAERYLPIEPLRHYSCRNSERFLIGFVSQCGIAVYIARKLVQEEKQGEGAFGGVCPVVESGGGASEGDEMAEFRGDFGVEGGRLGEPACEGILGVEPDGEDEVDVGVGSHFPGCKEGFAMKDLPQESQESQEESYSYM